MPVGDLGPDDVVTASPESTLGEITETLDSENVGAIVITEDESPVGIITDRDAALAIHQHDDVAGVSVEDVMSEDPATIQENEEAMEISRAIEEHNVRRFPIVDKNGSLTGIVTLDDLVATIGEQLDNVADTIEAQSPEYSP
ncbi:CBS domain-containing protein [Natronorubrum tibetense]|uniref:CBS domain containing protein n=1 Tax=Natronorubrum tibetense GA33 TaxID=1114856 RepID=L9VGT8_9EURY|nr:CBS domain-containing protein [Natronorubrum tibetense]ELY35528.1 CBS domain containing protein [Natronorubrum tibetense GA33]